MSLSFFCIAALAMLSTGCSALPFASSAGAIEEVAPADAGGGQYQVRMETFSGAKTYIGTIDGPITIQTALERSGSIKKYRNMEVELYRKVEGTFQPLKMAAIYDAGRKQVRPETDYGLRAGDSILVKTKSENPLSKVMENFSQ